MGSTIPIVTSSRHHVHLARKSLREDEEDKEDEDEGLRSAEDE